MVTVRPAAQDELDDVARLTLAAYEQYRQDLHPRAWEHYARDLQDVRSRADNGQVLVALVDGTLAGTASLAPHDDDPGGTIHLRFLAVDPASRRAGVARALMEAGAAYAREAGARTLEWNTATFMAPARALYERLGHVPAGEAAEIAPGVSLLTYRQSV